jgi:acyl-coenzyme A synthetase/AMP-(fatty) acid ligase
MDFCKRNLAKYKVPFKINILVELPKNETGKIMKKNLLTMVSDLKNNNDKVYQVQSSQLK